MGALFVWVLFGAACVASLFRPWISVLAYYCFLVLQPKWNWRFSLPIEFQFEKFLILSGVLGVALHVRSIDRIPFRLQIGLGGLAVWCLIGLLGVDMSIMPKVSSYIFDSVWKIVFVCIFAPFALSRPDRLRVTLRCLMIASFYSAYSINRDYFELGFCRYIQEGWGFRTGSNQASMMFLGLAFLCLCLAMFERELLWKFVSCFCFAAHLHVLMLLESRSCMLGFVFAFPVFLWYIPKTNVNIGILIAMLVVGSVLSGPRVVEEFGSIFRKVEDLDNSAVSRFDTWRSGLQVTGERPFFGHGPGMSGYHVVRYLPLGYKFRGAVPTKNPHNTPIEVLCDYGFIGFLCYYLFFLSTCVCTFFCLQSKPVSEWESCSSLVSLTGLFAITISSLFSSAILVEVYYMLAALGVSSVMSRHKSLFDVVVEER